MRGDATTVEVRRPESRAQGEDQLEPLPGDDPCTVDLCVVEDERRDAQACAHGGMHVETGPPLSEGGVHRDRGPDRVM